MTKLRKWFRRQYKRLKVKLHIWERGTSWFKAPKDSTGYENITTAIVRKMINHPDSKFTIAPLSGKRYIVNKTLDIFIIMEYGKVNYEDQIKSQISNTLQSIYDKISKQSPIDSNTKRAW